MPLNSAHLSSAIVIGFKEIPLDKSACEGLSYPTKIAIYDAKCAGCGFAVIQVIYKNFQGDEKIKGEFTHQNSENPLEDAIRIANHTGFCIKRGCSYPNEQFIKREKTEIIPLNEIIMNTCQFWYEDTLHIFSNEETEFIETETEIETEKVLVLRREGIPKQ